MDYKAIIVIITFLIQTLFFLGSIVAIYVRLSNEIVVLKENKKHHNDQLAEIKVDVKEIKSFLMKQ